MHVRWQILILLQAPHIIIFVDVIYFLYISYAVYLVLHNQTWQSYLQFFPPFLTLYVASVPRIITKFTKAEISISVFCLSVYVVLKDYHINFWEGLITWHRFSYLSCVFRFMHLAIIFVLMFDWSLWFLLLLLFFVLFFAIMLFVTRSTLYLFS